MITEEKENLEEKRLLGCLRREDIVKKDVESLNGEPSWETRARELETG